MNTPQRLWISEDHFDSICDGEITCSIRPCDDTGSLSYAMTRSRSRYGDGRHHVHFGPLIFESEEDHREHAVHVYGICVVEIQRVPEVFFQQDGCGSSEAFQKIERRVSPEDPVAIIMFENPES